MKTIEQWAPVTECPEYEVSTLGQVRRKIPAMGTRCGKVLKPRADRKGYLEVNLSSKNVQVMKKVHRLVALAFIGNPPSPRHAIAHLDGNPSNNDVANLRWATQLENEQDKLPHGTLHMGEDHYKSRLSDEAVRQIRILRSTGSTYRSIGDRFGIKQETAYAISSRRSWKHVV